MCSTCGADTGLEQSKRCAMAWWGPFGQGGLDDWGWSLGKGKGYGWGVGMGKAQGKGDWFGKAKGKGEGLGKAQGKGQRLGKAEGKGFGKDVRNEERPIKKKRLAGSGATSANRRAARAGKQWSALENADPGSVECLQKHTRALAAALEKAEAEKKRVEEEEARLKKGAARSRMRRATPKKRGAPAQAVEQDALQRRFLELRQRLHEKMGNTGLRSRSEEEKEEDEPVESLKKEDQEEEEASHSQDNRKRLRQHAEHGLQKTALLCDWDNTVEVGSDVPVENKEACLKLWKAGYQLLLCSYDNSTWREQEVLKDMDSLEKELQVRLPAFRFLGKETVRHKVGVYAKCAVAARLRSSQPC